MTLDERHGTAGVAQWLAYAEADEQAAQLALGPPLTAIALFHAREGAEKALKGVLVHLGLRRPPWTHNLDLLVSLISARSAVELPTQAITLLNVWPDQVTYPGHDEPTETEAQGAVAATHEIIAAVKGIVVADE